ncbi:MAG: hypothetical protein KKH94_10300 [Candidatus Omnitrophica bacterium]|nr:hypothetical protein [Candidatus Omnitrophota bacterium]
MKKIVWSMSIVFLLSGCIYSIELSPQYERVDSDVLHPLDVRVCLDTISSCLMQKCRKRSGKELAYIDSIFVHTVQEENFFKTVVPHGSDADLYIDVIHYPRIASDIPHKQSLYCDIMTLSGIGFITPIPFPFFIDANGVVQLKTKIDGAWYTVKEYKVHFKNTVWAASILGARYKRYKIQEQIVCYLVPIVIDYMKRDYAFFKQFETASKQKNIEQLKKLVHSTSQ